MHRVTVGTDIALIGAWDASARNNVLPAMSFKEERAALESDAQEGRVFLVQLGGDWGGAIDVFVEDALPGSYQKQFRKFKGKFLVSIPTGRLVLGGAEDYRRETPKITSESSIVAVPHGDYELQCYFAKDEEAPAFVMPSAAEFEGVLGRDDYRYYRGMNAWGMRGFWLLLLFPALMYPLGWKPALVVMILALVSFFLVQDWVLNRNTRYQRIRSAANELIEGAQKRLAPMFAIELRRLENGHGLRGGLVDFERARESASAD